MTAIVLVLLAVVGPRANAAEIKVFTARAGATVLEKIGPEFERATGNKLNVITGFGPRFAERIASGESFDILITGSPIIDGLIKSGKLLADSRIDLIHSGMGVEAQAGVFHLTFQQLESMPQALPKNLRGHVRELRLRIVQIEDIDGCQAKIPAGALDLVLEIRRRNAVHASGKVLGIEDAGLDVLLHKIFARIRGEISVEREIARLRANQDFITPNIACAHQLRKGGADVALRALMPIVDSGVDNVNAGLQRGRDRLGVGGIGRVVGFAEISAESDGREPEFAGTGYVFRLAKVFGFTKLWKSVAIASRSFRSRKTGDHEAVSVAARAVR